MLDYDSIQWFLVGFVVGVSDCPLTLVIEHGLIEHRPFSSRTLLAIHLDLAQDFPAMFDYIPWQATWNDSL